MNFDLNIHNYKKEELREMFDLPSKYTEELVDSKEMALRESILASREIKEEKGVNTIWTGYNQYCSFSSRR